MKVKNKHGNLNMTEKKKHPHSGRQIIEETFNRRHFKYEKLHA